VPKWADFLPVVPFPRSWIALVSSTQNLDSIKRLQHVLLFPNRSKRVERRILLTYWPPRVDLFHDGLGAVYEAVLGGVVPRKVLFGPAGILAPRGTVATHVDVRLAAVLNLGKVLSDVLLAGHVGNLKV
jgi:hypothetical protein